MITQVTWSIWQIIVLFLWVMLLTRHTIKTNISFSFYITNTHYSSGARDRTLELTVTPHHLSVISSFLLSLYLFHSLFEREREREREIDYDYWWCKKMRSIVIVLCFFFTNPIQPIIMLILFYSIWDIFNYQILHFIILWFNIY